MERKKIMYISGVIFVLVLVILFSVQIRRSTISQVVSNESNEEYTDLNLSQFSDRNIGGTTTKGTSNNIVMQQKKITTSASSKIGCSVSVSVVVEKNGVELRYAIKVSNQGNVACINVSLSAYYDDMLIFVSSSPKPTASNYYWELGNIDSGSTRLINITLQMSGEETSLVDTQICATANNATDACVNTNDKNVVFGQKSVVQVLSHLNSKPTSVSNNDELHYGSWVWVSPIAMSQDYMRMVVNTASENGINVLYVTIDDYLDINALTDISIKNERKKNYVNAIERFVRVAKEKGIAVDLEAGWRDWAETDKKYKAFAIIDFVIEYNTTHSDKIRAIQYDIEPYLLSDYANNKTSVLLDFVQLIDETVKRLGNNELRLSVVIPHFYDDEKGWSPAFTYDGISTHTYDHILHILDSRAGSEIIIMAYRNFAEGNNGTIDLVHREIDQASFGSHNTKIIIGQESGDVEPGYVTFFSLSKDQYVTQKNIIIDKFSAQSGFGGIAIHYIDSFLDLK